MLVGKDFQRSLGQPPAGLLPAEDQVGHGFACPWLPWRFPQSWGQCVSPEGRDGGVSVPAPLATFLSAVRDIVCCVVLRVTWPSLAWWSPHPELLLSSILAQSLSSQPGLMQELFSAAALVFSLGMVGGPHGLVTFSCYDSASTLLLGCGVPGPGNNQ